MKLLPASVALLMAALLLLSHTALALPQVEYTVRPVFQPAPLLHVTLQTHTAGEPRITLHMPVWCPGDYSLQYFGRYVRNFTAFGSTGTQLPVIQPNAGTWQVVTNGAAAIVVRYEVTPEPPGNFSQNLQILPGMVFVNGPGALMWAEGLQSAQMLLHVDAPAGWHTVTTLQRQQGEKNTFTTCGYDALADAPLLLAQHTLEYAFTADGARYDLIFFHHLNSLRSPARWVPLFRRLVLAENTLMGGPASQRYHFLLDAGGGLGGLEHADSARLAYWQGMSVPDYAPFVAHELFHSWNVKRIRPAVLGPFHYQHPRPTRCLWFAEGITEYFARVAVRRAGLENSAAFRAHWRTKIKAWLANPARLRVSADEASLHVWQTAHSSGYQGVSYYDKGELIGLCLDLTLRHSTSGRATLATMMRLLKKLYSPPHAGYHLQDLCDAFNQTAGKNLTALFYRLCDTTDELPLKQCLRYAGLDRRLQPLPSATPLQQAVLKSWERSDVLTGRE